MAEPKQNQRYIYDPTEVNLFQLLEDRRIEAQRQTEMLHKRIGDLRDELYDEVANSHKEIVREIREMKAESKKHHEQMEDRLSSLERWKWIVIGGSGSIGFVLALGMDIANLLK